LRADCCTDRDVGDTVQLLDAAGGELWTGTIGSYVRTGGLPVWAAMLVSATPTPSGTDTPSSTPSPSTTPTPSPTALPPLPDGRRACVDLADAAQRTVAVGGTGACALLTTGGGRAFCWGASASLMAVPPSAIERAQHISMAVSDSAAAALSPGGVRAGWGGLVTAAGGSDAPARYETPEAPARHVALGPSLFSDAFGAAAPDRHVTCVVPAGGAAVQCEWAQGGAAAGATSPPVFAASPASANLYDNAARSDALFSAGSSIALGGSRALATAGSAAAVAVTATFGCALSDRGAVACWSLFVTGAGDDASPPAGAPAWLSTSTQQAALTGGRRHACALARSGNVTCWGTQSGAPVVVPSTAATDVFAIAAGFDFTCVLSRLTGAPQCWGAATYTWSEAGGGSGGMGFSSVLLPPPSLPTNVVDVLAGTEQACVLTSDRTLACWGASPRTAYVPPAVQGRLELPCVQRDFYPYAAALAAAGASPSPLPSHPACAADELRAVPNHDLIGVLHARLALASEDACARACCARGPVCGGYAYAGSLLSPSQPTAPCVLLSNATQLVPSNFVHAGVRLVSGGGAA
jgi:hypothetical protein